MNQVIEALESAICFDEPELMNCYTDECDDGCGYYTACLYRKIMNALSALRTGELVVVDGERLKEVITDEEYCPDGREDTCSLRGTAVERTDDTCINCWKAYLQRKDGE